MRSLWHTCWFADANKGICMPNPRNEETPKGKFGVDTSSVFQAKLTRNNLHTWYEAQVTLSSTKIALSDMIWCKEQAHQCSLHKYHTIERCTREYLQLQPTTYRPLSLNSPLFDIADGSICKYTPLLTTKRAATPDLLQHVLSNFGCFLCL